MISTREIIKSVEYIPTKTYSERTILELFKEKYENTCNRTYGFIISIDKIKKNLNNKISIYNGNIICECIIEAKTLSPSVGDKMSGIIRQIFQEGLIVLVFDRMKVFIPNSPEMNTLKIGQYIQFDLIQLRFQKGRYDGIGKLIPISS